MHIIKITPQSFKIILSKEDLQRHGVENILEDEGFTGDFFAEIIDRTNALYGCPFIEGSVDAEFFASKDGGGELFLSTAKKKSPGFTYLFRTSSLENLISLCGSLIDTHLPRCSTLYLDGGIYCLMMEYEEKNDFLISWIKEFGELKKSGEFESWLLEEHAKTIVKGDAIQTICLHFGISRQD